MNFLPIPDYEGLYEINPSGHIRSLDRYILGRDGVSYFKKGKLITPSKHKDTSYLIVSLWKDNKGTSFYVHRLVAQIFIPNPDNKPEVNHIDGVRTNPHASNLEWVTSSENSLHAVQTRLRMYTNRLTKEEFIDCLFAVLDGESYYSLSQRTPYKVPFLSVKLRKVAKELNLEGELNESLQNQRIIRARINGAKNS